MANLRFDFSLFLMAAGCIFGPYCQELVLHRQLEALKQLEGSRAKHCTLMLGSKCKKFPI